MTEQIADTTAATERVGFAPCVSRFREHAAAVSRAVALLDCCLDAAADFTAKMPAPPAVLAAEHGGAYWDVWTIEVLDRVVSAQDLIKDADESAQQALLFLADRSGEPPEQDVPFGWNLEAAHRAILAIRAARDQLAAAGFGKLRDASVTKLDRVANVMRKSLHAMMRVDGRTIPEEWLADEPAPASKETPR